MLALPSSTVRTRLAKLRVQMVSSASLARGLMLANMSVLLSLDSESLSRKVRVELRKGVLQGCARAKNCWRGG